MKRKGAADWWPQDQKIHWAPKGETETRCGIPLEDDYPVFTVMPDLTSITCPDCKTAVLECQAEAIKETGFTWGGPAPAPTDDCVLVRMPKHAWDSLNAESSQAMRYSDYVEHVRSDGSSEVVKNRWGPTGPRTDEWADAERRLAELRKQAKQTGQPVVTTQQMPGNVRGRFTTHPTTGRWSSFKPNLQNVPVQSDPGKTNIEAALEKVLQPFRGHKASTEALAQVEHAAWSVIEDYVQRGEFASRDQFTVEAEVDPSGCCNVKVSCREATVSEAAKAFASVARPR